MKNVLLSYLLYCVDKIPYIIGMLSILYLTENKIMHSIAVLSCCILFMVYDYSKESKSIEVINK